MNIYCDFTLSALKKCDRLHHKPIKKHESNVAAAKESTKTMQFSRPRLLNMPSFLAGSILYVVFFFFFTVNLACHKHGLSLCLLYFTNFFNQECVDPCESYYH